MQASSGTDPTDRSQYTLQVDLRYSKRPPKSMTKDSFTWMIVDVAPPVVVPVVAPVVVLVVLVVVVS